MGNYLNPGNEGFLQAVRSEIYVDKTGLLKYTNKVLGTEGKCIALSHARRFGKSQAAEMLKAYYCRSCNSREIFERFAIAKEADWDRNLGKFDVIHLDIATLVNTYKLDLVNSLKRLIFEELCNDRPELKEKTDLSHSLPAILNTAYQESGVPFVIIIDEWDCIVRNYAAQQAFVHEYMQFLRDIFKSPESKRFLALGYITGILPIKKIEDESALNNFVEFTMLSACPITEFYGFTEPEVRQLCDQYEMDFDAVQKWYDGYLIDGMHIYNPNSVYYAMTLHKLDSFWKNTASFTGINRLILLNLDGLKEDILTMLAGGTVPVNVKTFRNDLSDIRTKDEALTALIHLGYLGYDADTSEAFVPNYEIATAFESALSESGWSEVARSIDNTQRALNAMLSGRAEEFAGYIDQAHEAYTSIRNYNDENALYSVLYMVLFTARAFYNVERELPSGKGFADMVLLPSKNAGNKPAVVLELKCDQSADSAIRQIKGKRYGGKLFGYADKVLLVGVNYDKDTKKHECRIEIVDRGTGKTDQDK